MLRIPRVVRDFAHVFADAGRQCYLVGGAVRDMLMGRPTQDFDIATDAPPAEVMGLFRRAIPTGIEHGTVTVPFHGVSFEVTTFRNDGRYTDGRRPERVDFVPTIEEDLGRRDFTINAIAVELSPVGSREARSREQGSREARSREGGLVDLHGGRQDIAAHVIRAIGDAGARFREDGLRLMRACRLSAQLGFTVEDGTRNAMRETRQALAPVAVERIREELERMLAAEEPSTGLEIMRETGLLGIVLPEIERCVGVEQRGQHCFDVYRHSLLACDAAPRESLKLRLAALLHDVGKPPAAVRLPDGEWTFHRHELLGAEMTESLLKRLRFPNALVTTVRHLVAQHMFHYTADWSDAAVRRFVARVGEPHLRDVLALRRADQIGTCGRREVSVPLLELERRIEDLRKHSAAFTIRDLAVDGRALMRELSISPGPVVGTLLGELLEAVLDDPGLNTQETLLGIARRFYAARIRPDLH